MIPTQSAEGAVPENPDTQKRMPAKAEIDLQALAEKVVRILKQEARIERERLGGSKPWMKKVTHA